MTRYESDSLGEVAVPDEVLFGAQTQRAVENFQISGLRLPDEFIKAVALIKLVAAQANKELDVLPVDLAAAIVSAAQRILDEELDGGFARHFPVDVYQTGSGTSTNMNVNEVIAQLAKMAGRAELHANDHVNCGQSSNDVIPSAITIASAQQVHQELLPALARLREQIDAKAKQLGLIVKTGRTHLMDAMPITVAQELSGWRAQLEDIENEFITLMPRFQRLALGGTAVGTGVNTQKEFPLLCAQKISLQTGLLFAPSENFFKSISSQDQSVALSGRLKMLATALFKIANDLRWMNSGPLAGLAEISLPALQPGSSIMPGKVNPVIPESVCMASVQVIGNDTTITNAAMSGNFQLNVMLPLIAFNLLQSIKLLTSAMDHLGEKAISEFQVNLENIQKTLAANPILVTALNAEIGYSEAAEIAKQAYAQKRPVLEVAMEKTDLSESRLRELLDPLKLTKSP